MRSLFAVAVLAVSLGFVSPARAGGLEDFLARVNVEARADMRAFVARVSAQFEVPEARVRVVLSAVSDPADAFMVFEIGRMCGRSPDDVLGFYKGHKGMGWGVMAKSLGIKPGSAEFHALKRGDLHFTGKPGPVPASPAKGGGKGHGKGPAKH